MNDRELLELAAKAVGFTGHYDADADAFRVDATENAGSYWWNPLESSGEALRLAVILRIDIEFWDGFKHVVCCRRQDRNKGRIAAHGTVGYGEGAGALPTHENVRRAIVRAAAEIGRTRP